jgi:hypothetical protein
MSNLLLQLHTFLRWCSVFLVEEQMKVATNNIRLMHHLESHLALYEPHIQVIEVPSRWKTERLGAPPKMLPKVRKEWAVTKTQELLAERGDQWSLEIMGKSKKKDDYGDCLLQLKVWWEVEETKNATSGGSSTFNQGKMLSKAAPPVKEKTKKTKWKGKGVRRQ